jgi:hypothetical protein
MTAKKRGDLFKSLFALRCLSVGRDDWCVDTMESMMDRPQAKRPQAKSRPGFPGLRIVLVPSPLLE